MNTKKHKWLRILNKRLKDMPLRLRVLIKPKKYHQDKDIWLNLDKPYD
jgi:hypothetical protein